MMPLLGSLLAALFGGLADFFVRYFTREVALRVAFGAMWVAGLGVVAAGVSAAALALSVSMPAALAEVLLFVFPGNVNACVSAVIATEATCAGYRVYLLGFGR